MATLSVQSYRIIIQPSDDHERARALKLEGSSWRKSGQVTLPLNVMGWHQATEEFDPTRHKYSDELLIWRLEEERITEFGREVNNSTLESWGLPDLWPTQAQAIERIVRYGSVGLFDDRGMGKTRVVIEALRRSTDTEVPSTLVISAKRLRESWRADTAKWWRPGLVVVPADKTWSEAASQIGTKPITILTYNALLNEDVQKAVHKWNPKWLVVDEAHNVKKKDKKNKKKDEKGKVVEKTNTKSGAIRDLPGEVRIAITGTPMPNKWYEVWTLLNLVAPNTFGSYWHFVQTLGAVKESYWGGKDISPKIIRTDIWEEVFDRWTINRDRPQHGKVWSFVPVELSSKEKSAYKTMLKEWSVEAEDGSRLDASTHLARLTRLQQLAGGLGEWETTEDETGRTISKYTHADPSSKVDVLLEMLNGLDRAVVWTRFRDRAEYVTRRILQETGVEPLLISGNTTEVASSLALARFMDKGQGPFVAVCVYGTISEGVNELVAASDVFFLDWTTVKDVTQAADRCDRPGQTKQVRCVTLYSAGTVEESGIDRESNKVIPLRKILRSPNAWKFLEEKDGME